MKKLRNIYRITIARKGQKSEQFGIARSTQDYDCTDVMLRRILAEDQVEMPDDSDLITLLEQKVAARNKPFIAGSSFAELLMPLFSWKYIELKMVAVTMVLVILLGFGPVGNHSVNRGFNPGILADTILDSSYLNLPVHPETERYLKQ